MNRIPPNLLYLTIYNPTLRPSGPVDDDNEDAEEQAHILFYTSKERAVSRDRMLRQIGLAKALVNFAELFNATEPCNNVHSQTRRLIMVSPEPNFWIQAGIEVARINRADDPKSKAKLKGKSADSGKEKAPAPMYEYEDGSVHDDALRAHVMKGYERFKLTHGSFTSILSSLGQQALELQLERFFTVWAWSWDLEDGHDFGEDFGPLLHLYFSPLLALVDEFSEDLSAQTIPVVLSPPHIIPSSRYGDAHLPASLASHLLSIIPPPIDSTRSSDTLNTLASSVDTIKGRRASDATVASGSNADSGNGTFLGMPAMNVDMRKWNWPGYLTFGKGGNSKAGSDKTVMPGLENEKMASGIPTAGVGQESHVEVDVNPSALEDAISSDSLSISGSSAAKNTIDDTEESSHVSQEDSVPAANGVVASRGMESPPESPPLSPPPLPEFSMTRVHLAPVLHPTATSRTTIHYFVKSQFMLALIILQQDTAENSDTEAADVQSAAERVLKLFDEIESTIYDCGLKSVSDSLPSATKILQLQDRFLMSTGQYTHASPGFTSKSSHLFNAKAILDIDPEINEVFSRGQNPQHWHIAKRGLGSGIMSTPAKEGNEIAGTDQGVFLEVFRKETSLTDVDNVLAGIVRKSGLVDGSAL
ncbi:hypothetical protein B0H34DRAFT_796751 [Crassisporium funariophilum]|nr:hypothetical protein B0H34DRAFT_796751 [Crassisporium funariophilum]